MSVVSPAIIFLLALPQPFNDPAAEYNLPPHAVVLFPDPHPKACVCTFELTTKSGACYEILIDYRDGKDYTLTTAVSLLAANWVVENSPLSPLRVYGARTRSGETDPVRSVTITGRITEGEGAMPLLRSVGKVTVGVKKRTTEERRKGPQRRSGPDIADVSFVEFDIAPLMAAGPAALPWTAWWGVSFRSGDSSPCVSTSLELDPTKPWVTLEEVLDSFQEMGCKAEMIGKTRLRVYGTVSAGRYYPALKGSIYDEDPMPEVLPKVTNARS